MRTRQYKVHFITIFSVIVGLLALAKCTHPEWLQTAGKEKRIQEYPPGERGEILRHAHKVDSLLNRSRQSLLDTKFENSLRKKNPVYSVPSFEEAFPDLNPLQLATAQVLGIPSIKNREDAELHKDKLVNIQHHPYFTVRHLTFSIPYLVPRAVRLLEHIALAYSDSLKVKGFPQYQLVVTSVLRSEADVARLKNVNQNASDNSCHRYGTTFDITYNHFLDVATQKETANVKLKSILAEVLKDFREMGTCYVKYEARQACFHITCR